MVNFLTKAGVDIEYTILDHTLSFLKGSQFLVVEEADWSKVKDPECLGRDLADYRYDLLEDWDGPFVVDRAWDQLAEWFPEDEEEIVEEAKKGFMMAAEEIINEWRADARYGHPSLTAAERNPGLR